MKYWYEFRLIFSEGKVRNWTEENYEFIRAILLPLVEKLSIDDFLILNYFTPNIRDYIRLRVNVDESTLENLKKALDQYNKKLIQRYEFETWDPQGDAAKALDQYMEGIRKRGDVQKIFGATVESKDWKVISVPSIPVGFSIAQDDYKRKVLELTTAITKVVGKLTRIFLGQIDTKPGDLLLMDMLTHYFLNSLCYSRDEESVIRMLGLPIVVLQEGGISPDERKPRAAGGGKGEASKS